MSVNHRKGISPLIAAVLLIAFTMAVAAILTAFVTTYTRDTTSAVGNTSERLVECSQASLEIRSVVYNATKATNGGGSYEWLNVTVENTGPGNLTGFVLSTFDSDDVFLGSGTFSDATVESANFHVFRVNNTTITQDSSLAEVRVRNQRCSENAQDTSTDLTNNTA